MSHEESVEDVMQLEPTEAARTHSPGRSNPMFIVKCNSTSVTRLIDLLNFGQLFKDFGNIKFAQISHILRKKFKGVKIYHFSRKNFLGNFYRHLAIWTQIVRVRKPP